jgi:hypothetical protein
MNILIFSGKLLRTKLTFGHRTRQEIKMTMKSLGNPFSSKTDLRHGADCGCKSCASGEFHAHDATPQSSEAMLERAVESAIVRSVFGHSDIGRRSFMGMVGGATLRRRLLRCSRWTRRKQRSSTIWGRRKRPTSTSASCRSPAPRRSSWRSRWASMSGTA